MTHKIISTLFITTLILTLSSCGFQQPDYLQSINSAKLNEVMQNEDIFLVDVHTPKQAHIKGTDLFIPYYEVEKYKDQLPKDKSTAIYLYCQGGPMAISAASTLHDLGYNNLFNLEGGSDAWRRAGFKFD